MSKDRALTARTPQRPRVVTSSPAVVVGILIVAMLAAAAVISTMAHQSLGSGLRHVAVYLAFALVGVIVAWHQPRNPMGWVLLGVTFFFILQALAGTW